MTTMYTYMKLLCRALTGRKILPLLTGKVMTNRAMKLLGLSGQKRQTTKSRYQLSSDWAKEVNALRV